MGRDKALLPWKGSTLAQCMARTVMEACGNVTLIGDPELYGGLGHAVWADRLRGCGPIGGVVTALTLSPAEWALVTGCDMPAITVEALRVLVDEAARTNGFCVVPMGPSGPEPLCAMYHRACLPTIERAIEEGRFKMREIVNELRASFVAGIDPACFANLNTPADFEALSNR